MTIAFRDALSDFTLGASGSVGMPGCPVIKILGTNAANNAGGGTSVTQSFSSLGFLSPNPFSEDTLVLVMVVTTRLGTGMTITLPKNSNNENWTLLNRSNNGTTLAQATYWKKVTGYDRTDGQVVVTITSAKATTAIICISDSDMTAPASAQYNGKVNTSSLTVSYDALGTWTAVDGISLHFAGMAYGGNTVASSSNYSTGSQSSSTGGGASSRTQSHVSALAVAAATTVASNTEVWTGSAALNIGSQVFIKQATAASTVVNGDVMLMCLNLHGTAAIPSVSTPPSGWTELINQGRFVNYYHRAVVYWKVASSEPVKYDVVCANTDGFSASVLAWSGADSGSPAAAQYAYQWDAGSSNYTATAPALGSWSSVNGMDVIFAGLILTVVTPPGSYTERGYAYGGGGNYGQITAWDRALSSVTTVGAVTYTGQAFGEALSAHVFIKEPGGAAADDSMPYIGGGYYP